VGGAQAIPAKEKELKMMEFLLWFLDKLFNLLGYSYFESLFNKWKMLSEAKKIKNMEQGVINRLNSQYVIACKIIHGVVPCDTALANRKKLDLTYFFNYAEKARPRLDAALQSTVYALESTVAEFNEAYARLDLELRGQDNRINPVHYLRVLDSSMKISYQLSRIVGDEFQCTPPQGFNSAESYITALRQYFDVNPDCRQNAGFE
jgi:hypothetical protein